MFLFVQFPNLRLLIFIENMKNIDKIFGSQIVDILKELQRDKTLIRMYIKDEEHEYLVIIEGVRTLFVFSRFLIYCSREFLETVAENQSRKIFFEFSKESIKYIFKTSITKVDGDKIWFKFPEFIEKYQRRMNFRVDVPSETKFFCEVESKQCTLEVLNISSGGFLLCDDKSGESDICFEPGEVLNNVEFVFPNFEEKIEEVQVHKIEIIRSEKSIKNRCRYYAVKIIEINYKEEEKLSQAVLSLQRYALRSKIK